MNFIQKINALCSSYSEKLCGVRDEARLYGIPLKQPPLAEHIIYNAAPTGLLQTLVKNYKRVFPKELLALYSVMNGANLFCDVWFLGERKIRIAYSGFSIYGVPLTYDRKHMEPYNISVEDLARPKGTPSEWLKFGSFYRPGNTKDRLELFIDTESSKTYAVEQKEEELCIVDAWDSLDNCLCSIFDLLAANNQTVYD